MPVPASPTHSSLRSLAACVAAGLWGIFAVGWLAFRAQLPDVGVLDDYRPPLPSVVLDRGGLPIGEFASERRELVGLAELPAHVRDAFLAAEDASFYDHGGIDAGATLRAAAANLRGGRIVQGGSTITQQLAKNLYLGSSRTPWRKLTELFVALRLERTLSKRRIFELYLNSIEWGNGVFGIEAAARRHFGVSAAGLNARQSVLLAAVIINPRKYSPVDPNRRIQNRARTIARRLLRRGVLDEDGYRLAIGEKPKAEGGLFDWLFGPRPEPEAPVDSSAADTTGTGETEPLPPDSAVVTPADSVAH